MHPEWEAVKHFLFLLFSGESDEVGWTWTFSYKIHVDIQVHPSSYIRQIGSQVVAPMHV